MSSPTTSPGGRLPLAERSALAGARLELFDRFTAIPNGCRFLAAARVL